MLLLIAAFPVISFVLPDGVLLLDILAPLLLPVLLPYIIIPDLPFIWLLLPCIIPPLVLLLDIIPDFSPIPVFPLIPTLPAIPPVLLDGILLLLLGVIGPLPPGDISPELAAGIICEFIALLTSIIFD